MPRPGPSSITRQVRDVGGHQDYFSAFCMPLVSKLQLMNKLQFMSKFQLMTSLKHAAFAKPLDVSCRDSRHVPQVVRSGRGHLLTSNTAATWHVQWPPSPTFSQARMEHTQWLFDERGIAELKVTSGEGGEEACYIDYSRN